VSLFIIIKLTVYCAFRSNPHLLGIIDFMVYVSIGLVKDKVNWYAYEETRFEPEGVTIWHTFNYQVNREEALSNIASQLNIGKISWFHPVSSPLRKWIIDLDQLRVTHPYLKPLEWLTGQIEIEPTYDVNERKVFNEIRRETKIQFIITPTDVASQTPTRPPSFDTERIIEALWVLECDETSRQGTAFELTDYGLITCDHVLGENTHAFRHDAPHKKYPVTIIGREADIDIAILSIETKFRAPLTKGTADNLKQMDYLAVSGFPNYRINDSGVVVPGHVVGFRTVSGIRRILTDAPIVAGNSGGPAIAVDGSVIGVAVTGAERMEETQETENHGIIPIDALRYLKS
jgi:hypothetical protein